MNDDMRNSIFSDSPALGAIDTMEEDQNSEGYLMTRHCEWCYRPVQCAIPWAELFCIAKGKFPQQVSSNFSNWKFSSGKLYPDMKCSCPDSTVVLFPMTPAQAQRLVQGALDSNLISPNQKAMIDQIHRALSAPAQPQRR